MNKGQLVNILRAKFLIDARPLNKVSGKPFLIREIEDAIDAELESDS
jgi:2-oxoglutarate ferredoxin oxidoreductase subunit alpha